MQYEIEPPTFWDIKNQFPIQDIIYNKVFSKYKKTDTVFEIIKKNGEIKKLSKDKCLLLSKNFALELKKQIRNKNHHNQIKIMGIIGASEESVILMLSSLYLAAHHCICFEDLSSMAIRQRLDIFNPDVIVCKKHLKDKVELALNHNKRINLPIVLLDVDEIKETNIYDEQPSIYKENYDLFTLFTSGSTGKPKSIIHGVNSYLNYAEFTSEYFFGLKKYSKIFTAVDAGWINGHTYAFYGPLLLGSISVINEMPTLISIPRILGEYLDKINPDCFYTSVTLLRLLKSMTNPDEKLSKYLKNNFRIERIGSCGEPLANHVGKWAIDFFNPKRKAIVNTYFQTETGGILVAPRDEDSVPKDYSCVGKPPIELGLTQAQNLMSQEELTKQGILPNELIVKNYWPGVFNKVISDKKSNYFTNEGFFRLHDVGYFDDEGFLYVGGRSDDVINVSGHRISTSEIESICLNLDIIKDACAVSASDQLSGEKIVLYFTPSKKDFDINLIVKELRKNIQSQLSKYHLPSRFEYFIELPKTQSGKIMRRIMRDLAENNSFNENLDYSTLANKESFLKSKDIFINSKNKAKL
tara:strand:+ start:1979 stop:3724 length:1746 start_codon:yes stop_codon:yes gene_type:complete